MELQFTKMHGLGNDFMVIELITQACNLQADIIKQWADRHTGIGFDQLLVVSAANSADADFNYRIFNADGSEVEQCGNGARCFARFVLDQGLTNKNPIRVSTNTDIISLDVQDNGEVSVNMGAPVFTPAEIPLKAKTQADFYDFTVNGELLALQALSMGNPHAVLKVPSVERAKVETLGPALEKHSNFPNRANVGFMEIVDEQTIKLRVYERGAGETRACGTGACAAAVAAIQQQWVSSPVAVQLPGGQLTITWQGLGQAVYMTGPATSVFQGEITI